MFEKPRDLWLGFFFLVTLVCGAEFAKYRICVVDGKGGFQKTDNYCPKLQTPESKVECIKGLDRFDCLRKLRKGAADFSIFTPEDLIAASNTENEILITNELRSSDSQQYEEQTVVVVSDESGITGTYDLHDKILCHPGYGSDGFVSEVLANFLETTIVRPQSCEPTLTVPENRVLSASKFFKAACKPGPWVNDPETDSELKSKYENLCVACDNPQACSKDDKYYGSSGSLLCLKDGAGHVSWTTYKQVRLQFGLDKNDSDVATSGFKFLCKDDSTRPLNTPNPCTWVANPWSVIAANRESAADVQKIVSNITHTSSWEGALLDLLEVVSYHVDIHTLSGTEAVDSYLTRIPGYLNANSFTGCHPPRTVKICTTSIPAQYKCGWMREAAAVHGLEPDIDCLKADNATHCMEAIQKGVADVVIVHPDYVSVAKREYNLKTLFYENVENENKYLTVTVVKRDSDIKTFKDLAGKRACFPSYDGIAWNTIVGELATKGLLQDCPYEEGVRQFFGESCAPGVPQKYRSKLAKLCPSDEYGGDIGALNCLRNNVGEVAFVSQNVLREFVMDKNKPKFDFRVVCEREPCYLSWSPAAQAMVSNNITTWRDKDILDVFLELDNLFGKKFKTATRMFTMYGEFDGKHNVLFNDNTVKLQKTPKLRGYENMPREYEDVLENTKTCIKNSSITVVPSIFVLFITLYFRIVF